MNEIKITREKWTNEFNKRKKNLIAIYNKNEMRWALREFRDFNLKFEFKWGKNGLSLTYNHATGKCCKCCIYKHK